MAPIFLSFFQCLLGLCYDNSLGGHCVSSLSSARSSNPLLMFKAPTVGVYRVTHLVSLLCFYYSEQWGDCRFGEPGWDPETSSTFPQGRPSPPVSDLSRDRPATSRTAGPTALESERKSQHQINIMSILFSIISTFNSSYDLLWPNIAVLFDRERFSPNWEIGVHTAHVILYPIRKMMKQPIMCFGSSFLAIIWSSVGVFNLPAPSPLVNLIKHLQRLHL